MQRPVTICVVMRFNRWKGRAFSANKAVEAVDDRGNLASPGGEEATNGGKVPKSFETPSQLLPTTLFVDCPELHLHLLRPVCLPSRALSVNLYDHHCPFRYQGSFTTLSFTHGSNSNLAFPCDPPRNRIDFETRTRALHSTPPDLDCSALRDPSTDIERLECFELRSEWLSVVTRTADSEKGRTKVLFLRRERKQW